MNSPSGQQADKMCSFNGLLMLPRELCTQTAILKNNKNPFYSTLLAGFTDGDPGLLAEFTATRLTKPRQIDKQRNKLDGTRSFLFRRYGP
jgi:hypothetical protein